jgi:hypothetical protein
MQVHPVNYVVWLASDSVEERDRLGDLEKDGKAILLWFFKESGVTSTENSHFVLLTSPAFFLTFF